MLIVSSGALKTYKECPQKYNLIYNKHVEIPSDNKFAENGKKIHALINYKLKGADTENFEKSLNEQENKELKTLWKNFLQTDISNIEKSELAFELPLTEDIKLTGRIDALRQNNGKYEILDWKTGKPENVNPEKDFQTIIYLYSIFEILKFYKKIENCENLSISYVFLKEKTTKTVIFSAEKHKEYSKIIKDICEEINSVKTYKRNEKICNHFTYKIVCERAYGKNNHVL